MVPAPRGDERVILTSHLAQGFGLPASDFLRQFLVHFGLQMFHLPANAVLFLAAYVTGVEAYLGLHPTVGHWAHFFHLKPQTVDGRLADCGGAWIYNRGSGWPQLPRADNPKGWQRTFFYVHNVTDVDWINLPPHSSAPLPAQQPGWSYDPLKRDPDTARSVTRLRALVDGGLMAMDFLLAWVAQRVLPLQRRPHKMCFLSGRLDPSWTSRTELRKSTVAARIRSIVDNTVADEWEYGMAPYTRSTHLPHVSVFPCVFACVLPCSPLPALSG